MDTDERYKHMSAVRSKGSKPEILVRKLTHSLGYRYRLHAKRLPGKPDLVFLGKRKVIFVHGCFWHGHDCRRGKRVIRTNQAYWAPKLAKNTERDAINAGTLQTMGWGVLVIWECETFQLDILRRRIIEFLG
ncbi:MAG: DNA mismatch endonuclease Vsr [Armatimonadetes bacterium]|nr:DNA mismatch endonuclease Vsr [Armatimonadota bacterium]MDE2205732.1 DNA mismatch endonuclease Vsr [Armatimonadota bacterium]